MLKVLITDTAKRDIEKLDQVAKKRLAKKIKYYLNLKDPLTPAEKLISPKLGTYRWRVGDYRVIFDVSKEKIVILRVRHRREVYRKL